MASEDQELLDFGHIHQKTPIPSRLRSMILSTIVAGCTYVNPHNENPHGTIEIIHSGPAEFMQQFLLSRFNGVQIADIFQSVNAAKFSKIFKKIVSDDMFLRAPAEVAFAVWVSSKKLIAMNNTISLIPICCVHDISPRRLAKHIDADPKCLAAAEIFYRILGGLTAGDSPDHVARETISALDEKYQSLATAARAGFFEPATSLGLGLAISEKSIETAIKCIYFGLRLLCYAESKHQKINFVRSIDYIRSHGGDRMTNSTLLGAVLGAYGIPPPNESINIDDAILEAIEFCISQKIPINPRDMHNGYSDIATGDSDTTADDPGANNGDSGANNYSSAFGVPEADAEYIRNGDGVLGSSDEPDRFGVLDSGTNSGALTDGEPKLLDKVDGDGLF